MCRQKFLVFFGLVFSIILSAQNQKLDSLEQLLTTIKVDSLKLQTLKKLAQGYKNLKPSKAYVFSKAGIALSKKNKNIGLEAYFTSALGYNYRKQNQLDSALLYFDKAKALFISVKDSSNYYYVDYDIGNLLRTQGKYEEAITYFIDAKRYFDTKSDSINQYRTLVGKLNLAAVYGHIGGEEKAISYYKELVANPQTHRDKRLLNIVYINLAGSLFGIKELDSALVYALKVKEAELSTRNLSHLKTQIGTIYLLKEDYLKALEIFKEARDLYEITENNYGLILVENNMSALYINLKRYDEAEALLLNLLEKIKVTNITGSKDNVLENLSWLYELKKDYKNAFINEVRLRKFKDSISNNETNKAISELEIKYNTEKTASDKDKAEAKVKVAEAKSKQNKTLVTAVSIIAGLVIISSLIFFSRLKERKKTELVLLELKETQKRLALEKQYRSSELKALKSQMNPHFIFNALNSIQEYIVLNEKKLASDYLGKFSDLIRAYLNQSNTRFITLEDEIYSLKNYLELEQLRFEDKLKFSINSNTKEHVSSIKIPTLIIQPYIENALNHGLLHKKDNRILDIDFIIHQDQKLVICTIKDNGIGRERASEINKKRTNTHKSFATKATQERLDLLNFGNENVVSVTYKDLYDDSKNAIGTLVTLNIPFSKSV